MAKHAPQATSGTSPFAWGTEERLDELFAVYGSVSASPRQVTLRARTPMEWVDKLRAGYAPVLKAFAALDAAGQKSLRGELLALVARFNRARDSTMVVDAGYLEVVDSDEGVTLYPVIDPGVGAGGGQALPPRPTAQVKYAFISSSISPLRTPSVSLVS